MASTEEVRVAAPPREAPPSRTAHWLAWSAIWLLRLAAALALAAPVAFAAWLFG